MLVGDGYAALRFCLVIPGWKYLESWLRAGGAEGKEWRW